MHQSKRRQASFPLADDPPSKCWRGLDGLDDMRMDDRPLMFPIATHLIAFADVSRSVPYPSTRPGCIARENDINVAVI